jgi:hypothetical protein
MIGAATAQTLMNAGVNQFVMDYKIATLRQRRENRKVRDIAATEIERSLRAEVGSGFCLKRLVLGMIAAQQPRSAGASRNAARYRRALPRR